MPLGSVGSSEAAPQTDKCIVLIARLLGLGRVYLRILRPHAPALTPDPDPLPRPLRTAFKQLDAAIERIYQKAALAA
jgi:hypothetical protein